ncbi:MAG: isoprenylcysteine carboxylmethyltransferase family protein [Desulfobaccales bacterium]
MDAIRYYIALVLVVTLPPTLLHWLVIHPFIHFWRRLGPALTYGLVWTVMGMGGGGLFQVRKSLLAVEFGTNYFLIALGVLAEVAAIWLWVLLHRYLALSTMLGLPELAPNKYPIGLITGGIYTRMRHPRYVQIVLLIWGYALIANYPAAYVVAALWLPGICIIARLEEKELLERYGAAYEEYCRRVPRFLPRWGKRED